MSTYTASGFPSCIRLLPRYHLSTDHRIGQLILLSCFYDLILPLARARRLNRIKLTCGRDHPPCSLTICSFKSFRSTQQLMITLQPAKLGARYLS